MIVSKNNKNEVCGWTETYYSPGKLTTVSVNGNITTISTQDHNTGAVESKTYFGTPLLPPGTQSGK